MDKEVLTGIDYISMPLSEFTKHPNFSMRALKAIYEVTQMTTTQLDRHSWANPEGEQ